MKKILIPFLGLGAIVLGVVLSGVLDDSGRSERGAPLSAPESSESATPESFDFAPEPGTPGATEMIPTADDEAGGSGGTEEEAPHPRGTGVLAGRVVDPDGAALAGAIIHWVKEKSPNRWEPPTTPPIEATTDRTETDAMGNFVIDGLLNESRYALFARSEGWVGKLKRRLEPDGTTHEIVLSAGDTVTGLVVDPRGGRVAGALVSSGPPLSKLGEGIFIATRQQAEPDALHPEVTSATDGSFVLSGIPFGEFSLDASHPTWGPSESINLMQGQSDLTIELRASTGVAGRVLDGDGNPIEGAKVQAVARFAFGADSGEYGSTITDAAGRFEIHALPAGPVQVRAEAEGFPRRTEGNSIRLVEGEVTRDLEVTLERGATIRGLVRDMQGAPVAGARVEFASGQQRHYGGVSSGGTLTDDEGNFEIRGLPPQQSENGRRLQVDHPEYLPFEGEPIVLDPGAEVETAEIVLADALTLRGKITDLAGNAIEGARVKLHEGAPGASPTPEGSLSRMVFEVAGDDRHVFSTHVRAIASATTDEDGEYILRVETPGLLHVTARGQGFQESTSEAVEVAAASVDRWDLSLAPALSVSGTVVDELGVPCAGVEVRGQIEGAPERTGTSDDKGNFLIDGLDAGDVEFSVKSAGWELAGEMDLVPAGSEGVTVIVQRPGAVAGRLIDSSTGRPITQFSLTTRKHRTGGSGGGVWGFSLHSLGGIEYRDPEGRFLIENLAPGMHEISASAPNMVDTKIEVEIASARTTETTIEMLTAGVIAGRVTDHAGNPLKGISVSAAKLEEDGSEDESNRAERMMGASIAVSAIEEGDHDGGVVMVYGGPPSRSSSDNTDEDGRYRIEGLAPGDYKVKFRDDGYRNTSVSPVTPKSGEVVEIETVRMVRGGSIAGKVQLPQGRNFMGGVISVTRVTVGESEEDPPSESTQIGHDGTYEIGGLDAGTYRVSANYAIEPIDHANHDWTPREHDMGTVILGVDEKQIFDAVLPLE